MTPQTLDKKTLEKVISALKASRRVLVLAHPRPDGDAIGSTVAAIYGLKALGKTLYAYNADGVPKRFQFLRGANLIKPDLPKIKFDTTLLLDCSDHRLFNAQQLPLAKQMGKIVVVDHHKTPDNIGDIVLRHSQAASTGVLVYQVFKEMGVKIPLAMAEAVFCTIMSDTGSFRYQNTNAEALRISAELIELGVNPWNIASRLYEDKPHNELKLLSQVLQTLEISSQGSAASLTVTEEMLDECGCTSEAVDGFINYARGVQGVEVAILFRPNAHGVRVSLRSRGDIDVSQIAQLFGGGGHHNAAGCNVREKISTLRSTIFEQVNKLCRKRQKSFAKKKVVQRRKNSSNRL